MTNNLNFNQKENWAQNETVLPVNMNTIGAGINQASKMIPLYAANGCFYTNSAFSSNVYTLVPVSFADGTKNIAPAGYYEGMQVVFKATANNTGNCSVNVNGLGAKQIKNLNNTTLTAGEIANGDYIYLRYNNAQGCFYYTQFADLLNFRKVIPTGNTTGTGLTKLYTETGENTDGTMTQKAIKTELDNLTNTSSSLEERKANIEFDNLAHEGEDRLNICKVYDTLETSRDKKGFEQVLDRKRSSFGLSKFTVFGSPTITDDGIASGFNKNPQNYIMVPINLSPEDEFDLVTRISLSSYRQSISPSYQWTRILSLLNDANVRIAEIKFNDNSSGYWYDVWDDTAHTQLTNYKPNLYEYTYLKLSYKNNVFKLGWSKDNINYTFTNGVTVTPVNNITKMCLGRGTIDGNECFTNGSIDLKNTYIFKNGVEVFNGNKTGIDIIKEDNYIVVGNPTISEDGIASNFDLSDNKIQLPNFIGGKDNFLIKLKFHTTRSAEGWQSLISNSSSNSLAMGYENDNKFRIYLSSNGTSWDIASNVFSSTIIQQDRDYYLNIEKNSQSYLFEISIDGKNYTNIAKIDSTLPLFKTDYIYLGSSRSYIEREQWRSSIDLNAFKIYVDGELVYQPTLRIPYTLSKTGSKIVDSIYKDRVEDVYAQYGKSEYYTLLNGEKYNVDVVGETKLENGVASNFSTNNYLRIILPKKDSSNIVVKGKIQTQSSWRTASILRGDNSEHSINFYINSSGFFKVDLGTGGSTWNIIENAAFAYLSYNTSYSFELRLQGTSLSLYLDGELKNTYTIAQHSYDIERYFKLIGYDSSSASIDLSELSIESDSVEVFRGYEKDTFTAPLSDIYGMITDNSSLKNFTPEGNDRFKAQNCYLTGDILKDEQGLNQVKEMKYSSFGLDKFEKHGDLSISYDGVVGNFLSQTNYLKMNATIPDSTEIKIKFRFKATGDTLAGIILNAQTGFTFQTYLSSSYLRLDLGNGTSWNYLNNGNVFQPEPNRYYIVEYIFKGNKVDAYIDGVLTKSFTLSGDYSINAPARFSNLSIGTRGWQTSSQLSGLFDLKQFSITSEGKEVFTGNKTGIDEIKPNNYTPNGDSILITDDNIVSNFTDSNYIELNSNEITTDNYKMYFSFTTGDIVQSDNVQNIITHRWSGSGVLGQIYLRNLSNTLGIDLHDSSGSMILNTLHLLDGLQPNTKYNCIVEISNGDTLYFYCNGKLILNRTFTKSTFKLFEGNYPIRLGASISSVANRKFLGSIDLNAFKIYVDEELVYQAGLKIPYSQSKTGSKIVPDYARSSVEDMYEQFGYAPYYTLSDKDYTLPKGEIYGLHANRDLSNVKDIAQVRVVVSRIKSGARWIEIYDDNWAVQGGTNNAGAITFTRQFVDEDFTILATNYSNKSSTGFTLGASGGWVAMGYIK